MNEQLDHLAGEILNVSSLGAKGGREVIEKVLAAV